MTVNYIKQKMNDGHAVLGPFLLLLNRRLWQVLIFVL